jgi:hypothetical protein
MKKCLLATLIAFLVSGAAFGDERKLQSFIDSESWDDGFKYCETKLLGGLSRRPDIRNVTAADLSRMSAYCAALAGRAGDEFKSGWWWYTAVSLDLDAAQALLPKLREKGLLTSLPAPRSANAANAIKLKTQKGEVRLPSGEIVKGDPPRAVTTPPIPKMMYLPVSGVVRAVVMIELIIARDGLPRQPLLLDAKALPAHLVFAYHFVSGFRFEPARVNGEPVDSSYTVTVTTQRQ